jgi:hypothetical protein
MIPFSFFYIFYTLIFLFLVMIASGGNVAGVNASVAGVVRAATPKVFHPTNEQANPVYIHAQQHKSQQGELII